MSKPLRVLVVGPKHAGADSRGGMAELTSVLRACRDPRVRVTTVATYVDAAPATRLRVGIVGMLRSVVLVLSGRVDVVHAMLSHGGSVLREAAPLLAARARGVPTVVHAHSFDFTGWFDGRSELIRRSTRRALRADRWYVLGDALAEEYRDRLRLDRDDVRVLRNPVLVPVEVAAPSAGPTVRALTLGRLGERKGSYDLVDAVQRMDPELRARLRLVLAGDGDVDQVRTAARPLGDTVEVRDWVGRAERDALLDAASVFVLPSHDEGLPLALLEAMAHGLAVVTTPVGAIPEIVQDGHEALLVAPGDRSSLAAALERVVADPTLRARLGEAARARASSFDISSWLDTLIVGWLDLARR